MGVLQVLILAPLLLLCVSSQSYSSRGTEGSGRRGDVLNTGDVDEQVIYNVDNSGRGSDGGGGRDDLDCETIMRECQCEGPPPPYDPPTPVPTQYQKEYNVWGAEPLNLSPRSRVRG